VLLCVIDRQVRQRVHEYALKREEPMLACAASPSIATPHGDRQSDRTGKRKAQRHTGLGRGVRELIEDGVPRRAPDDHGNDEQLPVRQPARHGHVNRT
jgi:hypothetical protein